MLDGGEVVKETLMGDGAPLEPSPVNIKYANRLAKEIAERLNLGAFDYAATFPDSKRAAQSDGGAADLAGHMDDWLATLRLEKSTLAGYSSAIKFWKSAPCDRLNTPLGKMALRDILPSHIKRAIASRPTLTGKTINNYVSVLREAFQAAKVDRVLVLNPADDIPRAKHQKDPPDPFSLVEAEKIIAYAKKTYPAPVAGMIEFWFFTGLRTSELFGLKWASIDWNLKQAQIREALVRGEEKDSTKTGVVRDLNLNSRSLAALLAQKAHTFMLKDDGRVWHDPRYGKAWSEERAFRRSYWTPALKACGIRYRRPYNCRHTFATMMLMSGMRPAYCANQMGHSVEMFLNTYAKWIDDGHADIEQNRLERFIGSDSVPESSLETKTAT